jgi:hypothetical protein
VAASPYAGMVGAFGGTGAAWTLDGRALPTGGLIPVGKIRVPLLLGEGRQGLTYDPAASAEVIMREMRFFPQTAHYTNLYYPAASSKYIGTAPYFPMPANTVVTGGSQQANALGAEQFWTQLIRFLDDPYVTNLSTRR